MNGSTLGITQDTCYYYWCIPNAYAISFTKTHTVLLRNVCAKCVHYEALHIFVIIVIFSYYAVFISSVLIFL